jgi:hypothetical protein
LQLNLAGEIRDRVIATMRFEDERVVPSSASKSPSRHKH